MCVFIFCATSSLFSCATACSIRRDEYVVVPGDMRPDMIPIHYQTNRFVTDGYAVDRWITRLVIQKNNTFFETMSTCHQLYVYQHFYNICELWHRSNDIPICQTYYATRSVWMYIIHSIYCWRCFSMHKTGTIWRKKMCFFCHCGDISIRRHLCFVG